MSAILKLHPTDVTGDASYGTVPEVGVSEGSAGRMWVEADTWLEKAKQMQAPRGRRRSKKIHVGQKGAKTTP
jgi:hypothetical protein